MSKNIRSAKAEDAQNLAKLIDIAGEGIPSWLWSKSIDHDDQSVLDIGAERARRTSGGFSFKNAHVLELQNQVAGMLLGYPILEAPEGNNDELPKPIIPFLELERYSVNTWYINALAVYAEHHGNGFGSALMEQAEAEARKRNISKMSIQVYGQNHGAVRLYKRLGYKHMKSAPVLNHPCQPYYTGDVLLLMKDI